MIASSVSPGTNSITMKKTFSCFSAVRMVTMFGWLRRGEQARLAQQLAEVDALLVRNLERDLLVDPGVFREVDRAEAAAADRRQDLVFADDLAAEKHAASIAARSGRSCRPPRRFAQRRPGRRK